MAKYNPRRKPLDFYFEVARNNVSGISTIYKFGENTDVDSASPEVVWDGGSASYPWTDTACSLSVQSTSTEDHSASSGARTVQLYGLDSDYNEIDETVTLNGTTSVLTTASFLRCYRSVVRSAGDGLANIGEISACAGGSSLSRISGGNNQSLQATYTVPANKIGLMIDLFASVNTGLAPGATGDVLLYSRPVGEVFQLKAKHGANMDGTSYLDIKYQVPRAFSEKTDIMVKFSSSTNNADISAGFNMLLVDTN